MPRNSRRKKPSRGLVTAVGQIQASNETVTSFLPGRRLPWMKNASTENSPPKPPESNGRTRRPLPNSRRPQPPLQPQHVVPSNREMAISSLISTMPPPTDGSDEKLSRPAQQQQAHSVMYVFHHPLAWDIVVRSSATSVAVHFDPKCANFCV